MKTILRRLATGFVILGFLFTAGYAAAGENAHTQVELISDIQSIQPGRSFWVAVHMTMEDGWQTYWKNPGDSGLPTQIEWQLPVGFSAGEIHWPYPQRFDYPEVTSYGYKGEVLLISEIIPPAALPTRPVTLKAHVKWMACGKICVPGESDVALTLPVMREPPSFDKQMRKVFNATIARWPLLHTSWKFRVEEKGNDLHILFFPPPDQKVRLKQAEFFPERNDTIVHTAKQRMRKAKNGYELVVKKSELVKGHLTWIRGVLVAPEGLRGPGSSQALRVDAPVWVPVK